jgi:hypothetical protein
MDCCPQTALVSHEAIPGFAYPMIQIAIATATERVNVDMIYMGR